MTDPIRTRVLLTPQQLKAMQDDGTPMTILAIQSVNPYTGRVSDRASRVPGAIDTEAYTDFAGPPSFEDGQRPLPDIRELERKARAWGLRHDRMVVVYDQDRSMTAARAWWVLRWAGLADVRVLDGGLPAWISAGMPTASAAPEPEPSDIALSPGHMPELDADRALALAREAVLLDARIRPNYIGGPASRGAAIFRGRSARQRLTTSRTMAISPKARRSGKCIACSAQMVPGRSASIAGLACRRLIPCWRWPRSAWNRPCMSAPGPPGSPIR